MALAAAAALALPTPKDIESAVNAGHLTQAESMLREVIQEKPQSAKAHYELGQVLARETRYADAHTELKKAKELLQTKQYTLNEVCYQVGYSDRKYFSKLFKERFGNPPSFYKWDLKI